MYTYLDLTILESANTTDPSLKLVAGSISITRKSEPGDEKIKVGTILKAEIGVDKLESPSQYYWLKRIE